MPLYDRQCEECSHVWETTEHSDPEPAESPTAPTCPLCGSKKSHRLIGHVSFVLNGRGWSRDGYSS